MEIQYAMFCSLVKFAHPLKITSPISCLQILPNAVAHMDLPLFVTLLDGKPGDYTFTVKTANEAGIQATINFNRTWPDDGKINRAEIFVVPFKFTSFGNHIFTLSIDGQDKTKIILPVEVAK